MVRVFLFILISDLTFYQVSFLRLDKTTSFQVTSFITLPPHLFGEIPKLGIQISGLVTSMDYIEQSENYTTEAKMREILPIV